MADIALEQLLHTAGDNTLSTTDGALHGYMRGTDGTTTRTVKTDANGNIIISPDSGLGTETTLAALATLLTSLNGKVATDAKLEAARLLLASLNGKDFATQTTLAAVLAKLADPATATKQDAAKGVLDTISSAVAQRATEQTLAQIKAALTDGSLKAQLSGNNVVYATDGAIDSLGARADVAQTDTTQAATAIALLKGLIELGKTVGTENTLQLIQTALGGLKTALTDGTQKVALTGTLTELFGASLSDRPPASSVSVGVTFMVVGTDIVYQSNGTDWVVIS